MSNKNWKKGWIFVAFAEYLNFNGSIGIFRWRLGWELNLKRDKFRTCFASCVLVEFRIVCILLSLATLLPTKTCPKVKDMDLSLAVSADKVWITKAVTK